MATANCGDRAVVDAGWNGLDLGCLKALHDLFWRATKKAGEAKKSTDPAVGQALIDLCDEVGKAFAATKS